MDNEYIGKIYRNADGLFIETLNNNLIKIDVDADALLAKDSLLGEQEKSFEKMLNEQLILAGLKKR